MIYMFYLNVVYATNVNKVDAKKLNFYAMNI